MEEVRVCAFFDVLGTRSVVTSTDQARKEALYALVRRLARRTSNYSANARNFGGAVAFAPSAQTTTFSDNVAVSFPLKVMELPGHIGSNPHTFVVEAAGFFKHLLIQVVNAVWDGLKLGLLFRGGITTGLLVHDSEIIAGPALVEAVELEKCTRYPRIEVASAVVDWAEGGCRLVPEYVRESCLVEHEGRWFVRALGLHVGYWRDHNYFREQNGLAPESVPDVLAQIRDQLLASFDEVRDGPEATREKWLWFVRELEAEMRAPNWTSVNGAYDALSALFEATRSAPSSSDPATP